ncbi:MAG: hypothetical protein HUJ68_09240, partial [Clostridia bacterium]|nr:hypothetical protein [Clostridia bacterium]
MPKINEKIFDKILKKDYNNELEKILEKKAFSENSKNLLLNILYKIDISYKDYAKVKQNVEKKEQIVEGIINKIQRNCDELKLITLGTDENILPSNKSFIVEKKKKRIICYPMERKILYC